MGKPYAGELERLEDTYSWTKQADLSLIQSAVTATLCCPIQAVGSGGSGTAAEFLTSVHAKLTRQSAIARTPLEFLQTAGSLHSQAVWLLSAGGRNIDIRRALQHAIEKEPMALCVLCGTRGSTLTQQVPDMDSASILEFESPAGKDGFLATNSLMGFVWLLARTYATLGGTSMPHSLGDALAAGLPYSPTLDKLCDQTTQLFGKEHLLVVYDPLCRAIATDVESRFSEAALGSVKICDLRSFAHGRHHWLAKYHETSAVLGISQPDSSDLASRTLDLLPKSITRYHLRLSEEPLIALPAGIVASLHFAAWRGASIGIDPGRPGVPEFGRRIYNLTKATTLPPRLTLVERAVERKAGIPWLVLKQHGAAAQWESHFGEFCSLLQSTWLKAIVLDYDGTLVSSRDRLPPPQGPLVQTIKDFLARGIRIGIASGRGGSVRRALREILPENCWSQVVVGYHNGSEISTLDDNSIPVRIAPTKAIRACSLLLSADKLLVDRLVLDVTTFQIGVQWKSPAFGMSLWHFLAPVIHRANETGLKVFSSGHSIDIVESDVTKSRVIEEVCARYSIDPAEVLCMGDQGKWPGNDVELLTHLPSLSVDEVSPNPQTCWRFTPPMVRGPAATQWYLSKLTWGKRGLRLSKGSFRQ